jgi:ABC-type lipoprotein release transport system permease subunit
VSQTLFVGRGLDVVREVQACPRSGVEVKEGVPLAETDYARALVGYELAQSFKLDAQKDARVSLQTQSPSGRANAIDVAVKGLTASSFPFENKRVVTVPLKLAQDLLDKEIKKLEAGQSTSFQVAQAQRDLVSSKFSHILTKVKNEKNSLSLLLLTGEIYQKYHLD